MMMESSGRLLSRHNILPRRREFVWIQNHTTSSFTAKTKVSDLNRCLGEIMRVAQLGCHVEAEVSAVFNG